MDLSKDIITHLHLSSITTRKCMWLTGTSTFRVLPAHIGPLCILRHGRQTSGPVDFIFPMPKEGRSQSVPEYIISKQDQLAEYYNLAWEQLRAVAENIRGTMTPGLYRTNSSLVTCFGKCTMFIRSSEDHGWDLMSFAKFWVTLFTSCATGSQLPHYTRTPLSHTPAHMYQDWHRSAKC